MPARLDALLAFLAEDPEDAFTRFALAQEYRKLGDSAQALHHFEVLRRDQPTYVGTYYHLGKLLQSLGRAEEAIAAYRDGAEVALQLRDTHARAELQDALLKLEMGFDDED